MSSQKELELIKENIAFLHKRVTTLERNFNALRELCFHAIRKVDPKTYQQLALEYEKALETQRKKGSD